MINISKFIAVGSLLLFGTNANTMGSSWDEYDIGLELNGFYNIEKSMALCIGDNTMDCMYEKEEYLSFFDAECNVCFPSDIHDLDNIDNILCYNKERYEEELDEFYANMKEIKTWDHTITNIKVTPVDDEYSYNNYNVLEVYTVTVKVNAEFTAGLCTYKTCGTDKFEIVDGRIMSYVVGPVNIKHEMCVEDTTTKRPTSWEKSTTPQPSGPGPVPPSKTPSWSPTTPAPTTPKPTTPAPTTPAPTTPAPTTPKPTTPAPTTPAPTTPKPTTPAPTTPKPTTPAPTTPKPTTAWPTPSPTTPQPTTPKPTTAWPTPSPTTPKPTTPKPTTPKPTTPKPTTPKPTTPKPTTPKPTTPKPTTPKPTTPRPTTPSPTTTLPPTQGGNTPKPSWEKSTTQKPKECNYNNHGNVYVEECVYGYECVKKDDYFECGDDAYCPGICIKEIYMR